MCERTACTVRGGGGRKPDQSGQHAPHGPGASRRPYSVADEARFRFRPKMYPHIGRGADRLRSLAQSAEWKSPPHWTQTPRLAPRWPHAQPFEMRGRTTRGWVRVDPEGLRNKHQLSNAGSSAASRTRGHFLPSGERVRREGFRGDPRHRRGVHAQSTTDRIQLMVVQSGGEPVSRSVIARAYRESPRKALPVDAGLPPKTASSRSRQPPWTDAVAGHYQRPAIPVAQLDRHVAVREAELQCWVAQEWRRSWNRTPGKPAGLLALTARAAPWQPTTSPRR